MLAYVHPHCHGAMPELTSHREFESFNLAGLTVGLADLSLRVVRLLFLTARRWTISRFLGLYSASTV